MKKIVKQGIIIAIAFFITWSYIANFKTHKIYAKQKTMKGITIEDIIDDFPEDIVDPGSNLPSYLSSPKIIKISNTNKGIKIEWNKVKDAHGYRIQRKINNGKWNDIKILSANKYIDAKVENGKKYSYKIYAYAANSLDFTESTGINSITKKLVCLKTPSITKVKKASKQTYKISWKKNKIADGYKIQIATTKNFQKSITKKLSSGKKTSINIKKSKKKKINYIRICSYKSNGTSKNYSAWSSIKTMK